ncbi:hypothetical protein Pmani_039607 [Petrolisthes manimaculis]|uniref:Uncharacterized protein n=1 Tax=Petrolisthes manimaculis TaxID=1843537 RepID=A0AAE1NC75_9EUCA|nr:hypothetical protein Pmani_039607 [Petrolisthes manimaculis]
MKRGYASLEAMMVGAANISSCSSNGGEDDCILGLPHPQTQLLEDDLFIKLEPENAQSSSLSSITPSLVSPTTTGPYLPVTLPTPPHSPPTEHDLDELVASIPEILESPSTTPPSDISDILSDLEGMETGGGGWVGEHWWCPLPIPTLEDSLKRDIMWGGGGCCGSLTPIKKERSVSECSADVALRDVLRPDDFSDDDDDDGLPDTPSGTDSDCDAEDHTTTAHTTTATTTTGHHHHTHHHSHHHTHHTHHHHTPSQVRQHHNSTLASQQQQQHSYVPPTVNSEHNYCGRVPDPSSSSATPPHGIVTPSDTGW